MWSARSESIPNSTMFGFRPLACVLFMFLPLSPGWPDASPDAAVHVSRVGGILLNDVRRNADGPHTYLHQPRLRRLLRRPLRLAARERLLRHRHRRGRAVRRG